MERTNSGIECNLQKDTMRPPLEPKSAHSVQMVHADAAPYSNPSTLLPAPQQTPPTSPTYSSKCEGPNTTNKTTPLQTMNSKKWLCVFFEGSSLYSCHRSHCLRNRRTRTIRNSLG